MFVILNTADLSQ